MIKREVKHNKENSLINCSIQKCFFPRTESVTVLKSL